MWPQVQGGFAVTQTFVYYSPSDDAHAMLSTAGGRGFGNIAGADHRV